MTTREQRIDTAVEFLDGVHGRDWPARINLTELDMANGDKCIIGELDGEFVNRFKEDDELAEAEAMELYVSYPEGAGAWDLDQHHEVDAKYDRLTKAWKTRVRRLMRERGL